MANSKGRVKKPEKLKQYEKALDIWEAKAKDKSLSPDQVEACKRQIAMIKMSIDIVRNNEADRRAIKREPQSVYYKTLRREQKNRKETEK